MLATAQYLGQDRVDEIRAEDALVPHKHKHRPVFGYKDVERVFVHPEDLETVAVSESEVLPRICSGEICQRLLNILSVAERKVIELHFLEGFSWEEIAEAERLDMDRVRRLAVSAVGKMRRTARGLRVS